MDSSSSDDELMNLPLASLLKLNQQSTASTSNVYSPGYCTDMEEIMSSGSEYSPECEVEQCKKDANSECDSCNMKLCEFHENNKLCDRKHKIKRKNVKTIEDKELVSNAKKEEEVVSDILEEMLNKIVHEESRPIDDTKGTVEIVTDILDFIISKVIPMNVDETMDLTYGREIVFSAADVGRSRKRQRNPETWKINVTKRLRHSGQEYVGHRGQLREAKHLRPPCHDKCRLKCSMRINNTTREEIFNYYWGLQDRVEQRHFISRHVEQGDVKRRMLDSKQDRNCTNRYFLYSQEERIQVCRVFFLNTLDIKKDVIYWLMKRSSCGQVNTRLSQGGHGLNKTPQESIDRVKEHIQSFPVVDSHYCRAQVQRNYLYPGLSVKKLHQLYKEKCQKEHIKPVKENIYYKIFNYHFNLGFFRPKKDQCDTCIAFNNTKNPTVDEKEAQNKHLQNKVKAREIKNEVKLKCSVTQENKNPTCAAAAFDFEQILNSPHGESSSFYYKRKLGVYNFSLYDYKERDVFCFMWPEYEGNRGSLEVGTCIYKYLEQKRSSEPNVNEVHFFSDNTAAQNRNRFVAFTLWYARKHLGFQKLMHTFLEVGHTETENDSVHSSIESKSRRITLYTPEQWYSTVRSCRMSKPYKVIEMSHEDFINWKAMSEEVVENLKKDDDGNPVYWTKVRQVKATAKNPDVLKVKTEFEGTYQTVTIFRKRTRHLTYKPIQFSQGIPQPGISKDKKNDLLGLCASKQIPANYQAFYESLPVTNATL